MKKNILIIAAVGILAVGAVASYCSPYWTMHEMRSAIVDNDADGFSSHVDFPALRENLRAQMLTLMQRKMGNDPELKGNGFAALGMVMVMGVMNQMIDTMVTPAGVMTMVSQGKAKPPVPGDTQSASANQPTTSNSAEPKNYSVRYKDWLTVIATTNEGSAEPIAFIFKRDGLWSWKLAGINLPLDSIGAGASPDQSAASAPPEAAADNSPASTTPPVAAPEPASAPTVIEISATDLYSAYDANEVLADNKYKGQWLYVSGVISEIGKDISNDPYINLVGQNEYANVHAVFTKAAIDRLATLHKGESIGLTCLGNGKLIGSPVLDCTSDRVPPRPQHQQAEDTSATAMNSAPSASDAQGSADATQPANVGTSSPDASTQAATYPTSFDCAKARSDSEHLVCGDAELAADDVELAALYAKAKAVATDQSAFKEHVRQKWNYRERTCHDRDCLAQWYADQKQWFTNVVSSQAGSAGQPQASQPPRAPTYQTSFDCSAPTFLDEQAICHDPGLAAMDREVAAQYAAAAKRAPDPAKLQADENGWVAFRRDCGGDLNCLRHAYGVRINQLQQS